MNFPVKQEKVKGGSGDYNIAYKTQSRRIHPAEQHCLSGKESYDREGEFKRS
jgi:hypothetical protein